jgi:thymidylate synthase
MATIDINYSNLLNTIMKSGYLYDDPNRKNVKRLEIPSYTFRHEFKDGFPAVTTKKLSYNNVVTELIWFLRGDTNIKYLVDNGCNIWNKDAYNYYLDRCKFVGLDPLGFGEFIHDIKTKSLNELTIRKKFGNFALGDLGPVYGAQWRRANGIDQIFRLINNLKKKPLATDHIVNSWNALALDAMALPPCHYGFQVIVRPLKESFRCHILDLAKDTFGDHNKIWESPKYGFELHWTQRSVDTFLGLPYNIASYATLALILEKITGYKALAIQGDLKKVHLYDNSLEAVKEQLSRDPSKYNNSKLSISPIGQAIFEHKTGDLTALLNMLEPHYFKLDNYKSYPAIKVEMLERNE